jgi:hypothetical protein
MAGETAGLELRVRNAAAPACVRGPGPWVAGVSAITHPSTK